MSTHNYIGQGRPGRETHKPPAQVIKERVISDEEAIAHILANWDEDRKRELAFALLGSEARAWWARKQAHCE